MDPKLQIRVQRYGWDLAASKYESLWKDQLAPARAGLLAAAALAPGARVLDVACGTGLVTFEAADAVGPTGWVCGTDLSDRMIDSARRNVQVRRLPNVEFLRADAQSLVLPDASVDVVLCALGLMYLPKPERALGEMRRVLRPKGRAVIAVWGERARCAWSALFPIVDSEVSSEVCPLFFSLGHHDALVRLCSGANFDVIQQQRIASTLDYADADAACDAAFVGGPVALAWSRFDDAARARVRARYLEAIDQWREGRSYRLPAEFVIVSAAVHP